MAPSPPQQRCGRRLSWPRSSGVDLHVVSAFPAVDGEPRDAVHVILDMARDALGDVDVAIHLHAEPGEPADAVCAVAARVGAGLIVVGNKGIDAGLRPAIADEVRKRAPCNVLVVDTEPYWHPVTGVEERRGRIPREWQILLVTTVAVFMAFLDVTIVNVAFPSIAADFPGTSLADLSWVLNAYNIVFAALLVPAGQAGRPDRPAAALLRRPVAVPGGLRAVRDRARRGLPDRCPRGAGDRRRGADPDVARARAARVPAGAPRRGDERLGGGGRGRRGDRPVARRRARRRRRLALGVPRQPRRGARRAAGASPAGRPHGPGGRGPARPARRRDAGGRSRRAGAGHRQGAGLGLDRRPRARGLARRGVRALPARGAHAPPSGAGAGAGAAAHPLVRGRQHGDARAVDGLLRPAARERACSSPRCGATRCSRRASGSRRVRSRPRSRRSPAGG